MVNTTYLRRVAAGIAAGTFVTLGFGVAAQADMAQSDAEPMSASSLEEPSAPVTAPRTSERAARQNNIVTLDLYKLTDVHGHISQASKGGNVTEAGLAAVGCYLDKARAANDNSTFTLLGDNIGASPYVSGSLNDNPTIEALNLLRPDASTIGNHELDMGQEVFKQRVDGSAAD
ncbi:MAG: bifunctional metallophosphatase/5'-nucleotidase, partial [Actinomyces sp.]|nr:bifunctional metallophosphatase/5'-nucleotidase [Actinomyces sp.]